MTNLDCPMCGYPAIYQGISTDIPKYKYKCTTCGHEYGKRNTYDYVQEAVVRYWKQKGHYPQEMIAFFYQKYEHEDRWEWCQELIECESSDDYESVTFLNDFCEGQTEIKSLKVVPLEQILDYYVDKNKLQERGEDE